MKSCETCRHTLGERHCRTCNYSTGLHRWEPKIITNADRIRSMNSKELAETLLDFQCAACDFDGFCKSKGKCKKTIMEWLRVEVNE